LNFHRVALEDDLWETMGMAKHKFDRATADKAGNVDGALCTRCGRTVELDDDGNIPTDVQNEECEREDFSQAAARVVREATRQK
jgi:hypothetical protein